MLTQFDLGRKLYLHPSRDLAVLHLEEEQTALPMLRKLQVEDTWELLPDNLHPLNNGQVLILMYLVGLLILIQSKMKS
jgi:hypothetical protein